MTPQALGPTPIPIPILHLIEESSRNPWLLELVRRADREKWRVIVASVQPEGELQRDVRAAGGTAFALGASSRREYPLAVIRLARASGRLGLRLVHAHNFAPAFLTMAARTVGARYHWLYTYFQQPDFFLMAPTRPWKRWLLLRLDGVIARSSEAIVAPSLPVRLALERDGIPPGRIRDVPVGFDIDGLQRRAEGQVAAVRREFDLHDRPNVVSVGRLSWEKDHPTLLAAWQRVVAGHPGARLILAGRGPDRAPLERLADQLRVSANVTFAGARSDVPALMAAADIVVHVALTESFGQVIAEALALGRPVIATDTGVVRHLTHEVHCLKVPYRDAEAVHAAIERIAGDPHLAQSLGENGRTIVRAQFGIDRNVRSLDSVYSEILTGAR